MVDHAIDLTFASPGFDGSWSPPMSNQDTIPTLSVDDLPNEAIYNGSSSGGWGWSGGKYPGSIPDGFGIDDNFDVVDLQLLRARSRELFQRNLYAAGLIRRLVTNEVNTGLVPQAVPMPEIIGMSDDAVGEWSDKVEEAFSLYANDREQFHYHKHDMTMSDFEQELRRKALIEGDVLVVERTNKFGTPCYEMISADNVVTPNSKKAYEGDIIDGVELDKRGRHIAYHVMNWKTDEIVRIPARGARSGRRVSWLVYGSDQKHCGVRGMPMLGLIMQSLKELDTYRDAETRAAVVNSFIAVYMTKSKPGMGSGAFSVGAVKREDHTIESATGGGRNVAFNSYVPGMMLTDLGEGEEPKSFDTKRPNSSYPTFETAMLSAIAWSSQIPPEILLMQFSHNYSASKAASAEFSIYLDYIRSFQASQFHKHVYESWLMNSVLKRRIEAPGMLEGYKSLDNRHVYRAWVHSNWKGAIKPSVDLLKDVRAFNEACDEGTATREQASLILFGGSFRQNIRTLTRENLLLAKAMEPLIQLERGPRSEVKPGSDEED